MGNCLKINNSDDISLLRGESVSDRDIRTYEYNTPENRGGSNYQSEPIQQAVYHLPSFSRPITNMTEEDQLKVTKRMGLIEHIPIGTYDGDAKKVHMRECVICMVEFSFNDPVRYLPCMHIYHVHCIDDWLMRSFTCPSCLEPVDAALLTSFETT